MRNLKQLFSKWNVHRILVGEKLWTFPNSHLLYSDQYDVKWNKVCTLA